MSEKDIRAKLLEKHLKITPQRLVILEAICKLNNHPTAESITDYVRKLHPNIATGTVYKVLETFVENGLIRKVKTDGDTMRYDAITDYHHHIYHSHSDVIEDYFDDELSLLLKKYFKEKSIPNFKIEDIRVQIIVKPK